MYSALSGRVRAWNERMNNLPRKAVLAGGVLLAGFVMWRSWPYVWPFVFAFVFSRILEPFVRFATKGFWRIRLGRKAAAGLGMLVLFGVVGAAATLVVNVLARELMGLVRSVPQAVAWVSDVALPGMEALYGRYRDVLPAFLPELLKNAVSGLGQSAVRWAGTLSAALTSGAWSTAASIPHAILSVVLMVMGTYSFTADRARIAAFIRRTLPQSALRHAALLRSRLMSALWGQAKSQLKVSMVVTAFLTLAMAVSGVRYGLLIGLLIGIADALPVLGAGLFFIPWSLLSFVGGRVGMGIFTAGLYVGTVVIRQVAEPRFVGKALGLHPLATMIAMYAGYRALGFLGILIGPVYLNVMKVIFEADGN